MEQQIAILLNKAIQKFVRIAKCARENQLYGQSNEEEFCLLTRLWSIIWTLQNSPQVLNYTIFREFEKIVNQIGGREELNYRPILQQPIEEAAKDCCDTISDLWEEIANLRDIVNYISPTLQLIPLDFPAGVYEVGFGNRATNVQWVANKRPLDFIRINWPANPQTSSPNLIGTALNININLLTANPVTRTVQGWYNDRQVYRGLHKLAEAKLEWKTVWPCYYGIGPENALDDPAQRNAFIHSLTRDLFCKQCHFVVLNEGEYFWYFYKFDGQKKQFRTDNGRIAGSFKGTITDFRTASMVENGILEGTEYGVIRFDNPGIKDLKLCVEDFINDDEYEIEEPEIIVPEIPVPEPEPVPEYNAIWTGLICEKREGGNP